MRRYSEAVKADVRRRMSPDWAVSFWIQSPDRLGVCLRLPGCRHRRDR